MRARSARAMHEATDVRRRTDEARAQEREHVRRHASAAGSAARLSSRGELGRTVEKRMGPDLRPFEHRSE
jgi:hypothetical protein